MARRKWTFLVLVCVYHLVSARPSQESLNASIATNVSSEIPNRNSSEVPSSPATKISTSPSITNSTSAPRDVKTKLPLIGESIKMVTSQLLQNPSNSTESKIVSDTRIPPKLKTQLAHKHKLSTRQENAEEKIENSHAGIAVPVTMEELESENKIIDTNNESSTSNEGISTWILLSNPTNKDNNIVSSTEATKSEETTKKAKPASKNKTKRPQQNNNKSNHSKRPIIGSTNKSDLIAGGSAINENVFNKIKDTVLSNVQKNKNASINRSTTTASTTTTITTTIAPTTVAHMAKKETSKTSTTTSVSNTASKPLKKKNKNKLKTTTTLAPTFSDSALLPMEPKVQEIELEISTPATTTKKPKRSSIKKKKKNKTKKKKTKPVIDNIVSETKVSNKTKAVKPATKKPAAKNPVAKNPITTQIYNYLSREVMPSVGVGIVGLAGLVGLAGYFLYPFSTPVRRTFEVDKKDNLYTHNAEEYASEGNGQAEEEMLGTVLAGMPANSKNKFNPYIGQNNNRYSPKKENDQNIRYRQVANKYESPNYKTPYQQNYQQKTGIAHGAVYSEPVNYNTQYETRHAYTTENRYPYDTKNTYSYSAAVEPIYAAPQTGPSDVTSYESDATSSVVYGVKPTIDTEFKPVYPFEGQVYSETTSQPAMTYPPTSMYLGSNNESDNLNEMKYEDDSDVETDNKFVVGNVPKELSDNVTPAIVPEHGPRKLNRRKRDTIQNKRSIVGSLEDILKAAKIAKHDGLSNEIDEHLGLTSNIDDNNMETDLTNSITISKDNFNSKIIKSDSLKKESDKSAIYHVFAVSSDDVKGEESTPPNIIDSIKDQVVESVSTLPIQTEVKTTTTEPDILNELEGTTKSFKVYEVFTTNSPNEITKEEKKEQQVETTTEDNKKMNTETTTDATTSTTIIPSTSPFSQTKGPTEPTFTSTKRPRPTFNPNIITYPPYNEEGSFFTFIKRLFEFKYRLGLSILQTTSDTLNRYLRNMESSADKMAKASKF